MINMEFKSNICTTEDQSERLIDLGLSIHTADLHYECDEPVISRFQCHRRCPGELPAWSLHRLMELTKYELPMAYFLNDDADPYEIMINLIKGMIKSGRFNKDYLAKESDPSWDDMAQVNEIDDSDGMTVKDLYKWSVENKCDNYKVRVQYRDEGGDYYGKDDCLYLGIDKSNKIVVL